VLLQSDGASRHAAALLRFMRLIFDSDTLPLFPDLPQASTKRPPARSGAQRQAAYRKRRELAAKDRIERLARLEDVTLARYSVHADEKTARECWQELGRRRGWDK